MTPKVKLDGRSSRWSRSTPTGYLNTYAAPSGRVYQARRVKLPHRSAKSESYWAVFVGDEQVSGVANSLTKATIWIRENAS
jgi:hypothetical protein